MFVGLPWPVYSLSLATGLGMTLAVMSVSVAPQAGSETAPLPILASIPYGLQFIATMLVALPLTTLFGHFGRKPVVISTTLLASATGLLGWQSQVQDSFWLLCLAQVALGVAMAGLVSLRFASADMVDDDLRPRAVALTSFGGVFGAVWGPICVRLSDDIWGLAQIESAYLTMAALIVILALLIVATPFPKAKTDTEKPGRTSAPELPLFVGTLFAFALLAGGVSYGVMSGLMTASNLEMKAIGVDFDINTYLIQFHVLAMFGPSLITGQVLKALGQRRFFALGILVLASSPIAGLFAPDIWAFAIALIMLGFGWNMLYVGGSALIAQKIQGAAKLRSQGLFDTTASFASAVASLSAAMMLTVFTWQGLQWGALALVGVVALYGLYSGFGTRGEQTARSNVSAA